MNLIKYKLTLKDITFLKSKNLILLGDSINYMCVFLPKCYFFYKESTLVNLKFVFNDKFYLKSLCSHILYLAKQFIIIYFLKLRLRGLGYRLKKISKLLYRFYFTKTSYIYFHKPKNLLMHIRKRKIILLSANKQMLMSIFNQILFLHPVGPYNKRGFKYPRQIIILKEKKKLF